MATPGGKSSKKQIVDVAKPGKTPAEPTSRPVIITHKMMTIKDPMVNATSKPESAPEVESAEVPESQPLKVTRTKVVAPLVPEPEKVEPAKDPVVPQEDKDESKREDEITDKGVVDAVAEQVDIGNKQKVEDKEELERKQALIKLIEEKKYILPIKQRSEKHGSKLSVIVLLLLLIVGGGYLAADAGSLKLPFALPVHFFKQNQTAPPVVTIDSPVATPKPTINTYKSTVDSLSLQYPLTWKISEDSLTGSPEYRVFEAAKHTSESKVTKVQLNRLSPIAGSSSFPTQKIAEVSYAPFTVDTKQLYIMQVFYSDADKQLGTRYGVKLYVTDQQSSQKVGDVPNDNISFLAKDNKTKLYFATMSVIVDTDNKSNFSSLENAKAFVASDKEFADALTILKSVKL